VISHCLGMIPGGRRDHSAGALIRGQRENLV
jgi:hypothetical protein